MEATLPGKTRWETEQYNRDRGQRAATALGYRLLADFIRTDASGPVPSGGTVYAPVVLGSDEERTAAVDEWAEAHGVPAGWDDDHHHYGAKLTFGPVAYMVYMIPAKREVQDSPPPREGERELEEVAA